MINAHPFVHRKIFHGTFQAQFLFWIQLLRKEKKQRVTNTAVWWLKYHIFPKTNMDTPNDAISEAGDIFQNLSFLVSMLDFEGG